MKKKPITLWADKRWKKSLRKLKMCLLFKTKKECADHTTVLDIVKLRVFIEEE